MSASEFLAFLGIELPIVQAPMAGVSSPAMAAAVSAAGGLGSIAAGASSAAVAAEMIASVRAATDKPFNLNLFCHRPARADLQRERRWIERFRPDFAALGAEPPAKLEEIYTSFIADEAILRMVLQTRPPVVSFHFGLPPPAAVQMLREAGAKLIATVTSKDEAQSAVRAGMNAVVAQGWEAGGHRGIFDPGAHDDRLSASTLTRMLVRECQLPVIAAGGVMDGAGINAMLALGASAVQLGTAFIACDESLADARYRSALTSSAAGHTDMTDVVSGRPARCLANRFTALASEIPKGAVPDYPIAYDLAKSLYAAGARRGDLSFGAHWAGQGAPLARSLAAADLVAALAAELDRSASIGRHFND